MNVQITWADGEQQLMEIEGYKSFNTGFIEVHFENGSVVSISPHNYRCFVELSQSSTQRTNE